MGQTLSEPITTKNTASCSNSRYNIGSSSMQGWRINMEDAHVHLLEMPNDPTAAFFGVFDGHGGARIAKYASGYLHKQIGESEPYSDGRITEALIDGFLSLDAQMRENEELREEMSGSEYSHTNIVLQKKSIDISGTAVVVLIKNNCVYCANAGDSRAVASISGKAVPLSTDHKPSNEEESRRIFTAGGWVEFNRVNGNLALSRAFGDFAFKNNSSMSAREQIVTAFPEIETHAISAEHEFIVLACDGIWDVMSNQEVVDFCRENLAAGVSPDRICEELLNKCLAPDCELSGLGCDNMTVILVCLLQDRTPEEYLKQLQNTTTVGEENEPIRQQNIRSDHELPPTLDGADDSEPGEIFSTPNHSPPLNAMREECTSEATDGKMSTETSDEDIPPNQFKVSGFSQKIELEKVMDNEPEAESIAKDEEQQQLQRDLGADAER